MTKGPQEKYETTLDNMLAGVVVHNHDTKITSCNAQAELILGLSKDQMIGKAAIDPTWNFVHEDGSIMEFDKYPVNLVICSKKPLNNYVLGINRPNRNYVTWVSVNGSPVLSEDNEIEQVIINFVDITETKSIQYELRKSLEKFRLMYENAPVAYQSLDSKGHILDINNVWLSWMGYNRKEVIGHWFGSFLISDQQDIFKKLFPINILKTETIRDVEFKLVRKDGSIIIADYTANIGRDSKGNFLRTHCVFQNVTEKREIESLLEENLKLIKNIMDHSTNMFYTHTVDHQITYVSPQVQSILGCSPEEAKVKWTEFLTDNPINEAGIQSTAKALETGEKQAPYELELQNIDGEKVWVEVWEAPIVEDNEVIGIAGSLTDITDRKEAEIKLEDQNTFLDTVINSSPVAMWISDLDGTIIKVNSSLCKILNLSPDLIIGKYNIFSDASLANQKYISAVVDVYEKGKSTSFTIFWDPRKVEDVDFSSSPEFWLEVSLFPVFDSKGNMTNVVCQWVDITTRVNTEFQLEEQKKFLNKIIDSTAISTWISDENGVVIRTNPACLKLFGAKEEEVIGKYSLFKDSVIEEQGHMPVIKDVFNKGIIANIIIDYNFADVDHVDIEKPTHKIVNSIFTPILDNNGNVTNVIVQTIDLSEIKNTESRLKAAKEKAEESDRLKSAFLANMSHEIRTPMNGILGFTDLLKEPGLSGEKQQKYINIIQKGGERMLTTINDIIEISKIETGQIEINNVDVNINEVLRQHFDFFFPEANAKGIAFNCQIPISDNEAIISADKSMLDSILSNLIKNAIKYTSSGSIDFGYAVVENMLKFYVKDTGVGISKDDQESVFERFIQSENTKNEVYEGSGLGLSITRAYIDMLDGEIWLESELQKGTTFYFTIPYSKITSNKNKVYETEAEGLTNQLKDLTVLITEDDPSADALLTEILEPLVKKIHHAYSSSKAMNAFEKYKIDLILMDVKIPGKDGLTLTREIRETDEDVIIIAQTAYAMSGDREKALAAGCNSYISKPISKKTLLKIIEELI